MATLTNGPERAPAPPPENRQLPLTISHAEMDTAFEQGTAVPIAQAIGWIIRHRGAWWVIYEDGWLRLIKSTVTDQLDQLYPRITEAEAQAAAGAARNRDRLGDGDQDGS